MKNLECSNCVIASSQNSNSFLERFDRMNPWRRRRNFKPMKLQNSLVGTKAFIKDSLRQCARLVKAFGTKLVVPRLGPYQAQISSCGMARLQGALLCLQHPVLESSVNSTAAPFSLPPVIIFNCLLALFTENCLL